MLLEVSWTISEWQTFLAVQAGAAVTLTGLVFVAASINLLKIIAYPGLPSRTAESIVQFLQVFFIATAGLIPRQGMFALGMETLGITLFSWLFQGMWQVGYARSKSGHPKLWLMIRIVQTQLGGIPLVIAGVYLLLGNQLGLYWLAPGFGLSFVAGVANAWVLLIEIHR